jgi:hypothetical protein
MEQASGTPATVTDHGAYVRVSVPMPQDADAYGALIAVVEQAASWGSSGDAGEVRVWATALRDDES